MGSKPTHSTQQPGQTATLEREVHANMNFLADDELHGRGSATRDEHIAALFVAAQLQALGLEPGGENGTFLQKTALPDPAARESPAAPLEVPERAAQGDLECHRHPARQHRAQRGDPADRASRPPRHRPRQRRRRHRSTTAPTTTPPAPPRSSPWRTSSPPARVRSRTIVFALFGSEELGGFGNRAFLAHPPVPLNSIVANLEFEMIGRPDPAVPAGHALAHRLRALQPRPRAGETRRASGATIPTQHRISFGARITTRSRCRASSPQTVSSFGLHKDYHQPSDELSTIDFTHMTNAIESMVESHSLAGQLNMEARHGTPAANPMPMHRRTASRIKLDLRKEKSGPSLDRSCLPLKLREVEAIEIHHLVPGRHKVTHEHLLRVAARIDFRERS